MYSIYQTEGLVSLWKKGLVARMLSATPISVMMISVYEFVKSKSVK